MPGASDKDSSVTKSTIGASTIIVKNQPNFDVAKLNRDTQNSLNRLGEIFDKKKIEERQELAKLIAKGAFHQLHYWNSKTKEDKAAKAIAHGIVGTTVNKDAGKDTTAQYGMK